MINTSSNFQTEMSNITRQTYGRIEWNQIDVNALNDVNISSLSTEIICNTDSLIDDSYVAITKYGTFENNRFSLSGSYILPDDSSTPNTNIGWLSNTICDEYGVFSSTPTISFDFTEDHSSVGFTVVFDITENEYAPQFDIIGYDSSNNIIDIISVTDNTDVTYVTDSGILNYRKLILNIKNWNVGYRRARIQEFLFGVIVIYDETNKLIEFTINEDVDLLSSYANSNTLSFSIDNLDKSFDIANPTGIYYYLQQQQQVKAFIGVYDESIEKIEYVPCGTYYLKEWKTDSNRIEASFSADDMLFLLQGRYKKGTLKTDTLYNFIEEVLIDAGLTSVNYNIDSSLNDITCTFYIAIDTYRQCLLKLALAGMCLFYIDRYNVVQIKPIGTVDVGYELSLDNSYSVPEMSLDYDIKQISTNYYSYNISDTSTEIYNQTITINGTEDIYIEYQKPSSGASAIVTNGLLNSASYYSQSATLNITANSSTPCTIVLTGNEISINSTQKQTIYSDKGQEYLVEVEFVTSTEQASTLINHMYSILSKRRILRCDWRTNPSLELNDVISVETIFGTLSNGIIKKQQFVFNGVLKGNSEVII